MFQGIRAVVFDLDGTLVDSAADLRVALNKILAEEGRPAVDLAAVTRMIGDGVPKLVERGFAATGTVPDSAVLADLVPRFLAHYEPHSAELTRPFPGAVAALARLHADGRVLGVCTNKPVAPTREILESFDLARYLSGVVGGDSIPGARKPDPRTLAAVLEQMSARPGEAAMVGDNAHDVATARALGLVSMVVSYGYSRVPAAELGADAVVDSLAEVPDLLAPLPSGPGQKETKGIG